jgi:tetratricopeptide (TPR) repeat protein
MRKSVVLLAVLTSMLVMDPACKLASRQRVQSINRLNEGILAEKRGNISQAEQALKEAIEIDPTHAKAHYTLGQVNLKQNRLVDAQKAFEAAIEAMKDEPNPEYEYNLGLVIASQADAEGVSTDEKLKLWQSAIDAFQRTTKLNDKHYKAFYRMGVLYEKLDQPTQADQAFRRTIELQSGYSPAFVSLGHMYIDYGHANVGQAVIETGVKVNDTDARMWNGLGRAQLELNKPQEAIESFKKAKAIDPDLVDVLFGLGMAYAETRQRKDAVENLSAFLNKAGADVPADIRKAANDTMARMGDVI